MPTRVLLEGPAIEPLLAQVRQEYGSGVRIISADKVRSGGFGGFFAKQRYELSVEVPDPTDDRKKMPPRKSAIAPPPPVREEPVQGLEQLLERAESNDRIKTDDASPFQRPRPSPVPVPTPVADQPPEAEAKPPERDTGREAAIEDVAAAADRRELSDNAAAFADLMAGLDAANQIATGVPPRTPAPPTVADDDQDTPTVRPFRPATATGSPINSGAGFRPLPPVPSLAELMGGLGIADAESAQRRSTRSAAEIYGRNAPPVPPEEPAPAPLRAVHRDPVVNNLIAVGMPESMATQIKGGDTYAGVLAVLAARPAAPAIPDGPGEVLVLAGEVGRAVSLGKEMLTQAGLDQSHLLLAGDSAAGTGLHSSRVISSAEAAATRAERLQVSGSAWIVVLDAPVGATDPIWVSDMCEALGATAVWAVVDATRKTADTARHLRTLGEVEALVVHSVDLTADPATVLGLELPIFSLDGKPATPHAWAAMLCARIAADVMPMAAAPRRQVRSAR